MTSKRNVVSRISTQDPQPIMLPKPGTGRAGSLLAALKKRKTTRTISNRKLPLRLLSSLLWAAFGVNRRKGPFGVRGRTAGSASNSQEIDIYVAMASGIYLYEAAAHKLVPVSPEDLRELGIGPGQGNAGADGPVRLIYVVNIEKFSHAGFQEPGLYNPEVQKSYYYVDCGLIAENVYLFAAAQGLAAWFHNCNRAALSKKLNLRSDQLALFGQTIGYPEKG